MILLGIAALLSLLLVVSLPGRGLWYDVLLDASHGPVFALVAVLLLQLQPVARRARPAAYVDSYFVAVGLGVLVEVLQSLAGRPGSPFDVMTDAAGAAAGLAIWSLLVGRRAVAAPPGHRRLGWPLVAALAGCAIVAWQPLQAARAYAQRAADFPTIVEFRRPLDLAFVTTGGVAAHLVELPEPWSQRPGEPALRLSYDEQHVPAVQVVEPSPDWRGYSMVALDLTNPADAELRLTLRIHDASHDWSHADRLNLPVVIAPRTRTTVRVALGAVAAAPASRAMDLSRIANVMLFGAPPFGPGDLYVSRLWLE